MNWWWHALCESRARGCAHYVCRYNLTVAPVTHFKTFQAVVVLEKYTFMLLECLQGLPFRSVEVHRHTCTLQDKVGHGVHPTLKPFPAIRPLRRRGGGMPFVRAGL